ncbi:Defensin-like protein P322 [Linum perenne]
MEKTSFLGGLLLVLILLHPSQVTMGEAGSVRRCEYESKKFKGTTCEVDEICAEVCKLEGFPGGDCRGYRTGCYCTKPC